MQAINAANANMMSVISGKTQQQETSAKWRSFDLVNWIRAQRLQWLGNILRIGKERNLKKTVFEMFKMRNERGRSIDGCSENNILEGAENVCFGQRLLEGTSTCDETTDK